MEFKTFLYFSENFSEVAQQKAHKKAHNLSQSRKTAA